MLSNLAYGAFLTAISVIIHTAGLVCMSNAMDRIIHRFHLDMYGFGRGSAMVLIVTGLFLLHMIEVFQWAIGLRAIGAFETLGEALQMSVLTFSTLGYGEILAPPEWQLLISMEGIIGFLLIGWSTAFLVSASTRYGPFKSGTHF